MFANFLICNMTIQTVTSYLGILQSLFLLIESLIGIHEFLFGGVEAKLKFQIKSIP